jgi:hypothetical protein
VAEAFISDMLQPVRAHGASFPVGEMSPRTGAVVAG